MDVSDRRELERRLKDLEARTAKMDVRRSNGGGGGGGSSFPTYRVATIDVLPGDEVGIAPWATAFIIGGDFAGGIAKRNGDNDAWIGWNYWTPLA